MKFEIGKTYGDYEFLDTLGSSKTVLAYRVRNVPVQRVELLRILPQVLDGDQERTERFLREIKVRAKLVHRNIVTFYHAGALEGQLVMTTEMVEGPTLAERLLLGPMPWTDAIAMLGQVLAALDCAHAHEIIHREVSPSNIILTPDKVVKLTGFGLAKATTDANLTQVGAVIGELKYMPPEQVKGATNLDGRSDLYSAGAVLYEAVTGSAPFGSKSQFDLMLAQVSATPQPPSRLQPDIPAELDRIILTALSKEPSQRFQRAEQFRAALEHLAANPQETKDSFVGEAALAARRAASVVEITSAAPASAENGSSGEDASASAPMLRPIGVPEQAASSQWGSLELTLAGVFMFVIATLAFLAFFTMGRS